MDAAVSKADLLAQLGRAKTQIKNMKISGEKIGESILSLVEVGGAAFLSNFMNGKMSPKDGEWAIKGVPVDVSAGLVLFGVGAFGTAMGVAGDHVERVGAGFVAGYLARQGLKMGVASTHPINLATGAAPASAVGAAPASSVGAAPASSVGALPSGWGKPSWAPNQAAYAGR